MVSVKNSGVFKIGGETPVHRLGYGAMRVTGSGIWGDPANREACLATLRRLPELGVDFIDTADSYGPNVSEELIHEALHPYGKILVATKGGLTRTGPNQWTPVGRPEYLIQQANTSRRRLACACWIRYSGRPSGIQRFGPVRVSPALVATTMRV